MESVSLIESFFITFFGTAENFSYETLVNQIFSSLNFFLRIFDLRTITEKMIPSS